MRRHGPRQRATKRAPATRVGRKAAGGLGTSVTAPWVEATRSATSRIQSMPSPITHSAGAARPTGHRSAATTAAGITTLPITGTLRRFATSP